MIFQVWDPMNGHEEDSTAIKARSPLTGAREAEGVTSSDVLRALPRNPLAHATAWARGNRTEALAPLCELFADYTDAGLASVINDIAGDASARDILDSMAALAIPGAL